MRTFGDLAQFYEQKGKKPEEPQPADQPVNLPAPEKDEQPPVVSENPPTVERPANTIAEVPIADEQAQPTEPVADTNIPAQQTSPQNVEPDHDG